MKRPDIVIKVCGGRYDQVRDVLVNGESWDVHDLSWDLSAKRPPSVTMTFDPQSLRVIDIRDEEA